VHDVGFVGNGADNTITMNRPASFGAGDYTLVVGYANAERNNGINYNPQVVSRFLDITESGGGTTRGAFRHNYSWNSFWDKSIPLTLTTASGSLTMGNATAYAPDIDTITLAKFVTGTPYTLQTADKLAVTATQTPAANDHGWNNTPVTVSFTCTDPQLPVTACSDPVTFNSEGAGQGATGTAMNSQAESASAKVGVNIDLTPPTITAAATSAPDAAGWYTGPVTIHFTCSDVLSGIATCPSDTVLNTAGTGQSVSGEAIDNAGNTAAATVTGINIFTVNPVLDNFNRANGAVSADWSGTTGTTFYKIANKNLDVQLGGPLVYKTSFGTSQEASVTLTAIDSHSPSQGVLLKVQVGSLPAAGAISVVYDATSKSVRVSTLRLGTLSWTPYTATAVSFANGDVLTGRVTAGGVVQVYRNTTLVTTVTLNAADAAFFNPRGGQIGIWALGASNATLDDFRGGPID
jgi:hypothetical protein